VDNFDVKVAKLKGEFVWHHHENEDEMFLIIKGNLIIKVRERDGSERDIDLHEGDFFVVPKGVEHKPVAAEEVHSFHLCLLSSSCSRDILSLLTSRSCSLYAWLVRHFSVT
jgi:mannose-6-phosphate isomerase-like protein (cupin superfamily)